MPYNDRRKIVYHRILDLRLIEFVLAFLVLCLIYLWLRG